MDFSLSGITSATLSLSGVFSLIDFLVLFFFYYRLRNSKTDDNKFFFYFKRFAFYFGIFPLVLAVPILLFSKSSFMLGMGYVIGHIFLYISCAYLARIWLLIAKPSFDSSIIFKLYLALGLAATVLNVYLFNRPVVNESGVTIWNAQPPVAIAIVLILISALLPAAVVFIREAIKQPKERRRFMLIGMSLIVIIIGGPLHDIATTASVYLVADIVSIFGYMLMLWGVLSGVKSAMVNKG